MERSQTRSGSRLEKQSVCNAFKAIAEGFSTDRVIADPDLNQAFLRECREQALTASDEDLNKCLLNARKANHLSDYKTTKQTSFADSDDYEFASEMGIRFLERRDQSTLDQVLCSPKLAAEFDEIAARICPGYSPLQYRWAALALRKKRRLKPEHMAHVIQPVQVLNVTVASISQMHIPATQGLYVFFDRTRVLYVGESGNLRKRITKHLEHSDNKGLARWLWDHGSDDLSLEVQVLPEDTSTRSRKALEAELIISRCPEFNVRIS